MLADEVYNTVQAVESPCLSILVPLLVKGLRERAAIARKTAVIIDNMVKASHHICSNFAHHRIRPVVNLRSIATISATPSKKYHSICELHDNQL